jgi:DegV family protein with EDD domain
MASMIKIVTDSTAYVLPQDIARYDIHVVPLRVIIGGNDFAEGVDIANEEFYRRLARYRGVPTTSQPTVNDFLQVYDKLTSLGCDILSIHISGKLSGTVNSAMAAKSKFPQARIEVVDWLSMGMGLLVVAAARAAEQGQELSQIKATIKQIAETTTIIGTLDTLKYLHAGGRAGARAMIASLLKIKPVLALDHGEVKVLAKPRSRSRAIQCMLQFVGQRVEENSVIHGAVVHAMAREEALVIEKEIRDHYKCAELYLIELGPVFGAHTGPGALGIVFYLDQF